MSRVTMFVLNDCRSDTRVLREADTLTAAGHAVTIMARPSDPRATVGDRESRGGVEIIRVPIPGRLRQTLLRAGEGDVAGPPAPDATGGAVGPLQPGRAGLGGAVARWTRRVVRLPAIGPTVNGFDWLLRWRLGVLAWCTAAVAASPPADVWHAHDLNTLPAADHSARRNGGSVIYDTHELFLESGANARRPAWAKRLMSRRERRLARRAARVITVNGAIADLLAARWGIRRPDVVMNCPPAWTPPDPAPDRLRQALGLRAGTTLALYHGAFLPDRGLAEAIAVFGRPELAEAHLVLLGDGPLGPRLRVLAGEPAVAGRVHLLPLVPPDEVLPWVASADVGVMVNQPTNLNERLSTPNKLFESLAAGLPVVSSDFPARRQIILGDPAGPLGAVCDPTDPAALAGAIAGLLALDPERRAVLRARILAVAHARYAWPAQAAVLLDVYAGLAASPGGTGARTGSAGSAGA